MAELPLGPDVLAAPALRRAVTEERARRSALEQENARLRAAVARQNAALAALAQQAAGLRDLARGLRVRLEAVETHNEALRAEVAALQADNARLCAALAAAQGEAGAGDAAPGQPPRWAQRRRRAGPKCPRKKRAAHHNAGRKRVPAAAVTRRVEHAVDRCPDCGEQLRGGWVHRTVQVIDLPPPPQVEVTEHVFLARRCGTCDRRVLPKAAEVDTGRLGRCRFGPRLLAAVAVMRTVERLPDEQIRARLAREYGLHLSEGGLVGLLRQVAKRATPAYEGLRDEVRASPVVHGDETGWREDGEPGWVWAFSTPTVQYFHRDKSRSGQVAEEILGADFAGTLISDFYAAYDRFLGPQQRCWIHLLRAIHELVAQYPADAQLAAWAAGVRALYTAAVAWVAKVAAGQVAATPEGRAWRAWRYEVALRALCPADLAPDRPEVTLAKRIRRYGHRLFTFVRDPRVPPDNNAAERGLRPLAVMRKISGGTRSPAGSKTRMVLASVLATAQLRGYDPLRAAEHLVRTGALPAPPPAQGP